MNDKLHSLIDDMMKELGFDFPEELVAEYRKKRIVVVDDETDEVIEVLREGETEDK